MTTIVVATGKNGEIGFQNRLLWHIPQDLKRFKKITSGHPVIMGRKTYESIGKPLPNRTNIVISKKTDWFEEGILIVNSIKEALKFAKKIDEDIFIIGGGKIYEQTLPLAGRIELTLVDAEFEADTFFPKINLKEFEKTWEECHEADGENKLGFCFQTMEKKQAENG